MAGKVVRLRTMNSDDLPFGVRLKDLVGWNQTEADWRRFLALAPDGCYVAECDGEPVGTAVACVFGHVGWIAMVLVDPADRRRGIGTQLVQHVIEHLERQSVRSIRLDATPLGRAVYEKLGFQVEYELTRWEGIAPVRCEQPRVALADAGQLEAIARFDEQLTGTPRRPLLDHLFHQQPGAMQVVIGPEGMLGYATWREGSLATFIGPAMAIVPEAGQNLVDSVLRACSGRRVFVDFPCDNEPASRWAKACGFTVQRPLTRMVRGEPVRDRPACLWASSGPENG